MKFEMERMVDGVKMVTLNALHEFGPLPDDPIPADDAWGAVEILLRQVAWLEDILDDQAQEIDDLQVELSPTSTYAERLAQRAQSRAAREEAAAADHTADAVGAKG
ncbi:hypothetical protein [Pedococcus sp. 5OH_020]|uniref:hypothetical protein n=1 Tax=Pedococcus sp. 5OH_020 TaxID=2989814 RepID=UPI0022E9FAFE|nr:hypothetical protein [Pedococcus sp. 5OH_020]